MRQYQKILDSTGRINYKEAKRSDYAFIGGLVLQGSWLALDKPYGIYLLARASDLGDPDTALFIANELRDNKHLELAESEQLLLCYCWCLRSYKLGSSYASKQISSIVDSE